MYAIPKVSWRIWSSAASPKHRHLDDLAHTEQDRLENLKEAETKQTVNKSPAVEAFKQPLYLWFAREQVVTLGAGYSLELLHKGAMVSYVLPKAFKNGANMIANGELVIELAGSSSMLDI